MIGASVRNVPLILLTMTSGCVDAISFLALGQVFTAAMTGNTVLFGLSIAHAGGLSAVGYLVAVLGFAAGAAGGAIFLKRVQTETGWSPIITGAIALEWLVLIVFGVVASIWPTTTPSSMESHLLILLLAIAMGIQGVTARRIGVNGVTTTVITSTLTGLMESIVWNIGARFGSRSLTRVDGVSSVEENGARVAPAKSVNTPVQSLIMWTTVIVFYSVGALLCGLLEVHRHLQAIWLPVTIVFAVIVTAMIARVNITARQAAKS